MFKLSGVYAAMLTPFDADGKINEAVIRKMVDFFVVKGIDGVFPISTVGEFILMTEDQKRSFVDIIIDQAKGRLKIAPGISSANPRLSIEFGKYCQRAGADAVVCSAPYYFKYTPDIIGSFIKTVAASLDLPFILYNIPMFANEITLDTLRKLFEMDQIVGMKDSSGSLTNLLNLLNLAHDLNREFSVMVGWEEMLLACLTSGGSGCMSASAGIIPELLTAVTRHYHAGKLEQAAKCQNLVARATEQMKKVVFPYGYKLGMAARGFDMGPYCIDFPEEMAPQVTAQAAVIRKTIQEVLAEVQT
jgi:dihydrodipicolinate synthase/N-acetylneuraminate lyase